MLNREEMKMEMLSKVNKEALEAYIQKTDCGGLDYCDLTETLNKWAEKKVDLYIKFGRELKMEKQVECSISEHQCRKIREDFVGEYSAPQYLISNAFVQRVSLSESSNNYLEKDYWIFGTRFAKGMRVSRCFKQMLPAKLVDDYQTKFSMFVQKFKVLGKAVVSIDPIDYLTMSVNNSGWRSCHIITNGIHKAGCLSYMLDASTAIAYVTDKEVFANRKYEGLSYNNKLWRQCVHIGDDFALQARQYPGMNISNKNAISEILKDMFNEYFDTDSFIYESKSSHELAKLQFDEDGNAYNDIEQGSFNDGGALVFSEESDLSERISINTEALCVRCGKRHVRYSDNLVCGKCADYIDYYNSDDCDDDDDYIDED